MLNNEIRITSEQIDSLGKLFLQVVIERGEDEVYRQVIDANDTECVIQMTTEAASALGVGLEDIEQELFDRVFKAREWWAKKKEAGESGDGYHAKFLTSAALSSLMHAIPG